jgi:hypothetical protein
LFSRNDTLQIFLSIEHIGCARRPLACVLQPDCSTATNVAKLEGSSQSRLRNIVVALEAGSW